MTEIGFTHTFSEQLENMYSTARKLAAANDATKFDIIIYHLCGIATALSFAPVENITDRQVMEQVGNLIVYWAECNE